MPELPEVETIRRDLEKNILHKTFRSVKILDPLVVRSSQKDFIRNITGSGVQAIIRKGKALVIELSKENFLLVQLMMTGQLLTQSKPDKHTRVNFEFTDGSRLLYNDQRRFGQLRVIKNFSQVKYLNILGPEPFEKNFNAQYIFEKTRGSKRPIKNLLLDHTFVAGIGNIYACEILFRCGISPKRFAGKITQAQAKAIYKISIQVLTEAIKNRGSSIRNYRDASGQKGRFNKLIQVYAREDESCLKCQTLVKRIIQAGRSTFYCSHCQK